MANINVDKQNKQEQQSSQQNPQTETGSSTAMQPSGQSGQGRPGSGLTPRNAWTPALFSLNPREFFSASPFELMRRFSEEMDRAFEGFGITRGGWGFGGESTRWSPAVEVFERDNKLIVRAELPGVSKDDVKVEMTAEGLIIQGERKREHEEKGAGWYRSERSYGQFHRLIPLPEGANADQTNAQFENGVLEVAVPIPESQRRRRNIPIGGSVNTSTSGTGNQGIQAQGASGGASKR